MTSRRVVLERWTWLTRTSSKHLFLGRHYLFNFYVRDHDAFLLGLPTITTKNSHITWEFSCKFKKICKKRLFPAIFSKNFNWQVIPSWVIISYKIIKFVSIFYKICCEKCFIQNILQKNWQQFPAIFFS